MACQVTNLRIRLQEPCTA